MMMEDPLMSVLPKDILPNIMSRLGAEDVCRLKCLTKSWLFLISSDSDFKKLARRPPYLVVADITCHNVRERPNPGVYNTDKDSNEIALRPVGGDVKEFRARKLVLKYGGLYLEFLGHYVSSCRDLMCFYTHWEVKVYSPSVGQYLRFDSCIGADLGKNDFRVGLVYLSSINAYKVVKMEVLPGCYAYRRIGNAPSSCSVRFTAFTVEEEKGSHGRGGVRKAEDDSVHSSTPWDLIGEYALRCGNPGNLIGVDGFAYAITYLVKPKKLCLVKPKRRWRGRGLGLGPCERELEPLFERERVLLSVDLETCHRQQKPLEILSLPPCFENDEEKTCTHKCRTTILSEVKNLLCYPHRSIPAIDLWLLRYHPDTKTRTWFKAYTISSNPLPYGSIGHLVYFPLDPTTRYDPPWHPHDDDYWAGLFLFEIDYEFFQYDVRTKESGPLLLDAYMPYVHVPTSNFFPLKNGLSCTSLPPSSRNMLSHRRHTRLPHPPLHSHASPPQLSHPPPPLPPPGTMPPHQGFLPPFPPMHPHASPPQVSHPPPQPPPPGTMPPHRGSLPPFPPLHSHASPPTKVSQPPPPPPPGTMPPHRRSLPPFPPLHSYALPTRVSQPPPPPPPPGTMPPHRRSLPPFPPLHSHASPTRVSQPPPPPPPGTTQPHGSSLPPCPQLHYHASMPQVSHPPPPPFDPQNNESSAEVKRRKLNSPHHCATPY